MKYALTILICLTALTISSCRSSKSYLPASRTDGRTASGYRFHLREWRIVENGPVYWYALLDQDFDAGGYSSWSSDSEGHYEWNYKGQKVTADFSMENPDVLTVDGIGLNFLDGRVFVCGIRKGKLVVEQFNVPIPSDGSRQNKMDRLATHPALIKFLICPTTVPVSTSIPSVVPN